MKTSRKWTSGLAAAAIAVTLLSGGGPALASVDPGTPSQDPAGSSGFGFFASQSFDDFYTALMATSAPGVAAKTLESAAAGEFEVAGLDNLDVGAREAVLSAAAEAALAEKPFTTSSDLGAPILGAPINNGHSWQFKDTYYWADCSTNPCQIKGNAHFTYTIDPGEYRTRLTVSTLEVGDALDWFRVDTNLYANGSPVGVHNSPQWQTNTTEYDFFDHPSNHGQWFDASFETTVWGPSNGIIESYEFRTGATLTCEEPYPGAYQCLFV